MSIARRVRLLAAPLALVSLAFVAGSAGCSSNPTTEEPGFENPFAKRAQPVIGGTSDTTDTFVVGIAMPQKGGVCSGTLIAPNLVLTARHCVSETTQTVDCTPAGYYTPKVTRDNGANTFVVTTDQNLNPYLYGAGTASKKWTVSAVYHVDDQNCPNSANPDCSLCGADISLLELKPNSTGFPAVAYASPAFTTPVVGVTYTAIGYGCQQPEPQCGNLGYRMTLDTKTTGVANYDIETDGHIAGGDSGGPYYDKARQVVYGVLSRGPQDASSGLYTRVDVHLAWIQAKALIAAKNGGYTAPAWVTQTPPAKPPAPKPLGADCSNSDECVALDPAVAPGACWHDPANTQHWCTQYCDATQLPCPSGYTCYKSHCWPPSAVPVPDAGPTDTGVTPPPDTGVTPDDSGAPVDDAAADTAEEPVVITTTTSSCTIEQPADRPPRPQPWIVAGAALAIAVARRRRRG